MAPLAIAEAARNARPVYAVPREKADPARICRRYEQLLGVRQTVDSTVQAIAELVCPRKSSITVKRSPGDLQTTKLYESTAIHASELLASSMHSALTSPASRWFALIMRDSRLNAIQNVRAWLEECANRLALSLAQSNFSSEVTEFYLDLVVPGTACMLMDEATPTRPGRFGGFRFRSLGFGTYVIAENRDGMVDTVYRCFKLPIREVVSMWPDTCGHDLLTRAKERPDDEIEILHGVYPRTQRDPNRRDPTSRPWASCYIRYDLKSLLEEGGYFESPFLCARWAKSSDEIYGRGPSHTAFPDIRSLNRLRELKLQAIGKAVDPPLQVPHQGVATDVNLDPASITTVTEPGSIRPIESGAHIDWATMQEQELQAAIRNVYFARQLELQEGPQMTATEVNVRYELMQRLLGPTLGRTKSEFHQPLIMRGLAMLARWGLLPPPPDELVEFAEQAGDVDVDIVYQGPLDRAQRTGDVLAIQRTYAQAAQIAEATQDPSVFAIFRHEDVLRYVGDVTGMPANLLRDEKEMAQMAQARAQKQAQQEQMAQLGQVAQIAKNAAPALTAVADVGQQMQESTTGAAPGA